MTKYIEIESGLYIPHPQNPDIVVFESGNQYLFICGYMDSEHLVKLETKADIVFPIDPDMTFGVGRVYETNFGDIYYWEC